MKREEGFLDCLENFLKCQLPKKIGDINNKDISFQYGEILGMRIKSLGFNMDFAPVMDINSNPKNPVIGGTGPLVLL